MTRRVLTAMDDPHLTILAHPTGRLLLSREPYAIDVEAVLEKAAKVGVAVELNADPHRLDLDWRWHQVGLELGCRFSINPDAHSVGEIDSSTRWGVAIARKGAVGPDGVVNALDAAGFARWLEKRKARLAAPKPRPARSGKAASSA